MITIYGLTDPRDDLVHYVGKTNKANRRLIEHRNEHGRVNPAKTEWIDSLAVVGLRPGMMILETTTDEKAAERELYWIQTGVEQGWPLVNKAHGYESETAKIDELLHHATRLGLVPGSVLALTLDQKRGLLGLMVERAEQALERNYAAMEAARTQAAKLESLIEQVTEYAHAP